MRQERPVTVGGQADARRIEIADHRRERAKRQRDPAAALGFGVYGVAAVSGLPWQENMQRVSFGP
jgi:hypothetical protein